MKSNLQATAVSADVGTATMRAVRVAAFGGIETLEYLEVPRPQPGPGQVLVQVRAAGVGPWDAWVRAGKSALPQPLPLTPGSDLAGNVVAVGPGVSAFAPGDAVFGVTNAQFTGAYAEYAVAEAGMLAPKPARLGYAEAAAAPVVASTAWQMLFDHGGVQAGQRVLIHGAAGSVGGFAVQLARRAGASVIATAFADDLAYVERLGAARVLDARATAFEDSVDDVDVVIDLVGGSVQERSFAVLKPGGVLVSSVAPPDQASAQRAGVRAVFFLVAVTRAGLIRLGGLLASGELSVAVGETLPLAEARRAHAMLEGAPHRRGKIVLIP